MQNLIKTLVENARVFANSNARNGVAAHASLYKIYFVGGIVRDLLLGLPVKDIDIVVEGDAIKFCKYLEDKGIVKIKSEHGEFGTVKTVAGGREIDFASTRQETYPQSGCLPTVTNIGCPLKDDVLRRDFTINAIALRLEDFELVDYTGGIQDLRDKTLRTTYDKSFIDDPTRILRGLDFRLRFSFTLDKHTEKMQRAYLNAPDRSGLSAARVDLTLKKLLENSDPGIVYEHILNENLYKIWRNEKPRLSTDALKEALEKLPGDTSEVYFRALKENFEFAPCKARRPIEVYKFFKNFGPEELTLYFANCKDSKVLDFKSIYESAKINTTGYDLIKLGYQEGKLIGRILDALLEQTFIVPMTAEQEKAWILANFPNRL
ncbi:CCA-adding tRNA nucleotidyltransferase [Candidatus Gastranaerophilus sp. (ex Termes propinquus)]|nr:CCA-adding tRNA nucleotidyltransferase [Candidatus Gastranaerophilus sp. (ex Termes propinquus)]